MKILFHKEAFKLSPLVSKRDTQRERERERERENKKRLAQKPKKANQAKQE